MSCHVFVVRFHDCIELSLCCSAFFPAFAGSFAALSAFSFSLWASALLAEAASAVSIALWWPCLLRRRAIAGRRLASVSRRMFGGAKACVHLWGKLAVGLAAVGVVFG